MRTIMLLIILFFCKDILGQMNDENKRNQIESMVYKQWKFTPQSYYYSWYTEKILGVKIRVPGIGLHDRGPGGIGGGDNYVNGDKRNIYKYTPTVLSTKIIQDNMTETSNSENNISQRELVEYTDNVVDVIFISKYASLLDLENQCKMEIQSMVSKVEFENIIKFNAEMERIQNLILSTRQSSIPNSDRLESYTEAEEAYINLLKKARSLNKLYKKFNSNKYE